MKYHVMVWQCSVWCCLCCECSMVMGWEHSNQQTLLRSIIAYVCSSNGLHVSLNTIHLIEFEGVEKFVFNFDILLLFFCCFGCCSCVLSIMFFCCKWCWLPFHTHTFNTQILNYSVLSFLNIIYVFSTRLIPSLDY